MYLHNLDTQILLCFYDMRYPCSQAGDRTVLRFVDLEVILPQADMSIFSEMSPTGHQSVEAGVQQLKEVIGSYPKTPIYALGGINAETIGSLLDCPGCCGVAAIDLIAQLTT